MQLDKTLQNQLEYIVKIWLLKQISGVQIFTTTHNTDLMSNDLLRPDSYFSHKNNSIKAISELTEKELRQAHNLQKMYNAGAFNGRYNVFAQTTRIHKENEVM